MDYGKYDDARRKCIETTVSNIMDAGYGQTFPARQWHEWADMARGGTREIHHRCALIQAMRDEMAVL